MTGRSRRGGRQKVDVEERRARLAEIAAQVRGCTQCRLCASRRVAVPGEGPLDVPLVWVGEAPGKKEDATGRPFVGASGALLRREMAEAGIAPESVFITNVVKCHPPENRQPRADEIAICTGLYLTRQVELTQPEGLVALGATAAGALLAGPVRVTEEHGAWRRDYDLTGRDLPVFVTYHPAAAVRSDRWREELRADLRELAEWLDTHGYPRR